MGDSMGDGTTQLTVAAMGVLALLTAGLLFLVTADGGDADHSASFAVLVAIPLCWIGLLTVSTGLLISPGEASGISLSRGQRHCIRASSIGSLGVIVLPAGVLVSGVAGPEVAFFGAVGSFVLSVGGLALGVLWRGSTTVLDRWENR